MADSRSALRVLGRFHCHERLASRPPFETFRARTQGLAGFDRSFAVKCLAGWPGEPPNAAMSRRFVEVARRAAGLRDPRIAMVVDAGEADGTTFVATEFVFGATLASLRELSRRAAGGNVEPLPATWPKLLAHIGAEIGEALASAHGAKPAPLVHGALAPANVFLSSRGVVKVADFGHAMLASAFPARGKPVPLPPYPAPELALVNPGDAPPSADVWALGAMLFELATGEKPPSATAPRPAAEIAKALAPMGEPLAQAVASMLEKEAGKRPTARELPPLLRGAISGLSDTESRSQLGSLARRATLPGTTPVPDPLSPASPPVGASSQEADTAPERKTPAGKPARGPHRTLPLTAFDPGGVGARAAAPAPSAAPSPIETLFPLTAGNVAAVDDAAPLFPPESSGDTGERSQSHRLDTGELEVMEISSSELEAVEPPPRPAPVVAGATPKATPPDLANLTTDELDLMFSAGIKDGEANAAAAAPASTTPAQVFSQDFDDDHATEFFVRSKGKGKTKAKPLPPAMKRAKPADEPPTETSPRTTTLPDADTSITDGVPAATASAEALTPVLEAVSLAAEPEPANEAPGGHDESPASSAEHTELTKPEVPALRRASAVNEEPAGALPTEEEDDEVSREFYGRSEVEMLAAEQDPDAIDHAPRGRRPVVLLGAAALALALAGGAAATLLGKRGGSSTPTTVASPAATTPRPSPEDPPTPAAAPVAAAPTPAPADPAPSPPAPAPATGASTPDEAAEARPAPGAEPSGSVAQVDRQGRIRISFVTDPPGATVWLNGSERGQTPIALALRPGELRLTVVRAGFEPVRETFDASAAGGGRWDKKLSPAAAPKPGKALLAVECTTPGKYPVSIDGVAIGALCPVEALGLPPGPHEVSIYVPWRNKDYPVSVKLRAGAKKTISYPK